MNRIVVGANYGLKDWLLQRITAVVMATYTVLLALQLIGGAAASSASWRATFSGGFMRFATFIFIVCLCYHAWVGVRDIWMDYVTPAWGRVTLHVLTALALVGYAGWAVQILWRL